MNQETRRTDDQLTPEQMIAAALNEQGFLLQSRLTKEVESLRGAVEHQHNWSVEATEIPVSLPNGRETRIDLLLRSRASGTSPWYAAIECKRASRDFKRWIFFGYSAPAIKPHSNCYYMQHADLAGIWNHRDDPPMHHRLESKPAPPGHEAFEYYIEARNERRGTDKAVSATTAIEDAFQQITLGQAGLAIKMLNSHTQSFRILPIVITTAQIMSAEFPLEAVGLHDGKLTPNDLTLQPKKWVAVNYRVNDTVSEFSRFSARPEKEIAVDLALRLVRTIFVVEALSIHEFLSWLWNRFDCSI